MLRYPAAERNKEPILKELLKYIKNNTFVLEIGSGTGQHVAHFAQYLPKVKFHPTEIEGQLLNSIQSYIKQFKLTNVNEPEYLDVTNDPQIWMAGKLTPNSVDYFVNINMIHITPIECCEGLFRGCSTYLKQYGLLFLYGPFAYDGVITPQSNINFDRSLRASNPMWGLRDVNKELIPLATKHHLHLQTRHQLPANNDLIIWKKDVNLK